MYSKTACQETGKVAVIGRWLLWRYDCSFFFAVSPRSKLHKKNTLDMKDEGITLFTYWIIILVCCYENR